jgi:hypothetical protein
MQAAALSGASTTALPALLALLLLLLLLLLRLKLPALSPAVPFLLAGGFGCTP